MALSVEKRTAFALPLRRIDMFASVMPTSSQSSFDVMPRLFSAASSLTTIAISDRKLIFFMRGDGALHCADRDDDKADGEQRKERNGEGIRNVDQPLRQGELHRVARDHGKQADQLNRVSGQEKKTTLKGGCEK